MNDPIYAIGDIHGQLEQLQLVLDRIERDGGPDAKIIFFGRLCGSWALQQAGHTTSDRWRCCGQKLALHFGQSRPDVLDVYGRLSAHRLSAKARL